MSHDGSNILYDYQYFHTTAAQRQPNVHEPKRPLKLSKLNHATKRLTKCATIGTFGGDVDAGRHLNGKTSTSKIVSPKTQPWSDPAYRNTPNANTFRRE